MWAIGMICGPVLGGLLVNPAERFPSLLGDNQFLIENPYFLPCALSAAVSLVGFLVGCVFLEETLKRKSVNPDTSSSEDDGNEEREPLLNPKTNIQKYNSLNQYQQSSSSSSNAEYADIDEEVRDSIVTLNNNPRESACTPSDESKKIIIKPTKSSNPYLKGPAILSILAYSLLCFESIILEEIFSLWSVTPPKDGIILPK
jgi:hypothetical protein